MNKDDKDCKNENKNSFDVRAMTLGLLMRIEKKGGYSNLVLDGEIKRSGSALSSSDRALLTRLVYGVTERKITLDYIIDSLSSLSPGKIEARIRNILRMGLYQLCYLDKIPSYAAVNECVSLAGGRSRAFVNALLREFCRRGGDDKCAENIINSYTGDTAGRLSVRYSFPIPLVSRFISGFGVERTESLLNAFCRKPPLTLRVNTLLTSRDAFIERLSGEGISAFPTRYSPNCVNIENASFSQLSEKTELDGLFFVQDEASELCVRALGAQAGDTVIDACACPGSKSFGISADMENTGRVLSFDLHENKLPLIIEEARRLNITIIETARADGRIFVSTLEKVADRVLCDVPCSGFGVVAKKPEIRYKNLDEVAGLPPVQLAILSNNARYVKDGGTLVYSTCTLLREENEDVVTAFLAENPDFTLVPVEIGEIYEKSGMLTLTPDVYMTDGFFIAKMKRSSNSVGYTTEE